MIPLHNMSIIILHKTDVSFVKKKKLKEKSKKHAFRTN